MGNSSLSDLKGIGCKMIWTVQISPVFGAKGTTICLKTVKIFPRPDHFSHRFFKSDRLLVCRAMHRAFLMQVRSHGFAE
jgi:hypothetical protein